MLVPRTNGAGHRALVAYLGTFARYPHLHFQSMYRLLAGTRWGPHDIPLSPSRPHRYHGQ